MRAYNMKFNPTKCAFSVSTWKFLGFMVIQRRIKVNPAQVKFILETPTSNNKKELQRLTGHLTTLGRFIAHFTDKLQIFFFTLKKANTFSWTNECKKAFEVVKHYLTKPPILSSPKSTKEFYMYLAVSNCTVSSILFWHIWDKEQRFIYYVSKAKVNVETWYF